MHYQGGLVFYSRRQPPGGCMLSSTSCVDWQESDYRYQLSNHPTVLPLLLPSPLYTSHIPSPVQGASCPRWLPPYSAASAPLAKRYWAVGGIRCALPPQVRGSYCNRACSNRAAAAGPVLDAKGEDPVRCLCQPPNCTHPHLNACMHAHVRPLRPQMLLQGHAHVMAPGFCPQSLICHC